MTPNLDSRTCPVCFTTFSPVQATQIYCQPKCKRAAARPNTVIRVGRLMKERRDRGQCIDCSAALDEPVPGIYRRCAGCAARTRRMKRARRRVLRLEIITGYGGKCTCCGESRWEFMAIDHVNGGGNQARKKDRNGFRMLQLIRENNFPDTFRLLCHNCNQSRGHYGYCPHEREREREAKPRLNFIVNGLTASEFAIVQ